MSRILVHLESPTLVRRYERVFGRLLGDGYAVTVYVPSGQEGEADEGSMSRPATEVPGVTVKTQLARPSRLEENLTWHLWTLADLLHELGGDSLREQALPDAPPGVARWARRLSRGGRPAARTVIGAAHRLDRLAPASDRSRRLLDVEQPDLVLASPGLGRAASMQADLLKASSLRGIPTGILIASWDDLATKGLIRCLPDRIWVWNELQREDLERLHGVPAERVSIVGSPAFDRWFEDGGGDRREFCARVDLDPDRPYVLYLASSRAVAPGEPDFFEHWLSVIRSADDNRLRDVQVLVRPHPSLAVFSEWLRGEFDRLPGVAVWPDDFERLTSSEYESDYAGSMRHCALAFGLNTGSMVDVAIFGKAVCTWEGVAPGARQRETPHYRQLLHAGGGLLHVATSAQEHVAQLSRLLPDLAVGTQDAQSRSFVAAFVRPRGLDREVAPLLAAEIAGLAVGRGLGNAPGPAGRALGRAIGSLGFLLGLPLRDRPGHALAVRFTSSLLVGVARGATTVGRTRPALLRWEKQVRKGSKRIIRASHRTAAFTARAVKTLRR